MQHYLATRGAENKLHLKIATQFGQIGQTQGIVHHRIFIVYSISTWKPAETADNESRWSEFPSVGLLCVYC